MCGPFFEPRRPAYASPVPVEEGEGPGRPAPIRAVLFDFHMTLVDQGDPTHWLALAWRHAGRAGDPVSVLGRRQHAELADWINRIWEHAADVDPQSRRDLSPAGHRAVYDDLVERLPGMDPGLADSLYAVIRQPWFGYEDAVPRLSALRARGVATVLVSNAGIDIRGVLETTGSPSCSTRSWSPGRWAR